MDEHFHSSKKLPEDILKKLMQKNDQNALIRFLVMYILFLATCIWVVFSWSGHRWQLILSQLCFGILSCSMFAALHETAHNTAFKSRRLNQLAAWLAGLAHLYPATIFRELHFTHHRHTHVPGLDPEISLGNRPMPSVIRNLPSYISWLTGLPLLLFKLFMLFFGAIGMPEVIRKKLYPFIRPEVRLKLAMESMFVLLFHLGLLLLALFVDPGFWGLFTGQVIGHCMLAGYLTPEHNGLPHEGNVLNRTRSIRSSSLVKFLMWNMPYHAEHHAYPSIPLHALSLLHEEMKGELVHKDDGHLEFNSKVFRKFF